MKVDAVADVHIGNHKRFGGETTSSINTRCRMVLDVFEEAVKRVALHQPHAFVIAGDLLDYARPEAPIVAEVQRILGLLSEGWRRADSPAGVYILMGNHEQTSASPGDHALGPLAAVPGVHIIEKPTLVGKGSESMLLVPFQPGAAKDWLAGAVHALVTPSEESGKRAAPPARPRLLVLHLGIRDEKTPPWLRDSSDAIDIDLLVSICKAHGITKVMAGNWHDRQCWTQDGVEVLQLGALCPTGWDNPGLTGYGTLAMWDSTRETGFAWDEIPGPRFVKTRTTGDLDTALSKSMGGPHRIYISDVTLPEDIAARTAQLAAAQAKYPALAGFEVLPDETFAKAEARTAAAAASNAETFDESLDTFIANMPLPDGVQRERVLQRAREYVKP